jgi:DnaJ domain
MDPFALLGLPKRPLLSEEEIGAAYRQLASTLHPDQAGGSESQFKELREAVAILRSPARRLRELAHSPIASQIPTKAAELFPVIATILVETDNLMGKQIMASNALTKAVLVAPMKTLKQELDSTLLQLQSWRSTLDQQLVEIDSLWPEHDSVQMNILADSYSYSDRWKFQLTERMLLIKQIL